MAWESRGVIIEVAGLEPAAVTPEDMGVLHGSLPRVGRKGLKMLVSVLRVGISSRWFMPLDFPPYFRNEYMYNCRKTCHREV